MELDVADVEFDGVNLSVIALLSNRVQAAAAIVPWGAVVISAGYIAEDNLPRVPA